MKLFYNLGYLIGQARSAYSYGHRAAIDDAYNAAERAKNIRTTSQFSNRILEVLHRPDSFYSDRGHRVSHFIQAIKEYRNLSGADLKTAKEFVESVMAINGITKESL